MKKRGAPKKIGLLAKAKLHVDISQSEREWLRTRSAENQTTIAIEVRRLIWDARREAAEDGR